MEKVLLLTKVFLKNSLNLGSNSKKKIGNLITYIFVILYMFFVVGITSYDLIKTLININMEELGIIFIFGAAISFTAIQSILVSMNVFYFSKENENILPLPIKPKELILAKVFQMLVVEDFIVLIMGIPYFVLYMILCDMGILFLLRSLFLISIIPIISICVVTFIMMILTSINKQLRNKDMLQFLNIGLVFLIIFITTQLAGFEENFTSEDLGNYLQSNETMVALNSEMPLLFKCVVDFCIGDKPITNLCPILLFIGIVVFLFVNLSKGIYVKTLTKINTSTSSRSIKSKTGLIFKKKNKSSAYVLKEIKILFRNPIFFLQCVLPSLLIPVIMIAPFLSQIESINLNEIRNFFTTFDLKIDSFLICAFIIGLQLLSIFIYIAVTAFSREGTNAVFAKYIPISFEKQITYKIIPNVIFASIWPIIIGILVKYLIPTINIWIVVLALMATVILNIIFSYIGVLIDLKRPKLIWETEYAVVKNNMNMLIHSIFQSFGVVFITVATIIINIFTKDILMYLVILNILVLLVLMIMKIYIKKNQAKLMKNIC